MVVDLMLSFEEEPLTVTVLNDGRVVCPGKGFPKRGVLLGALARVEIEITFRREKDAGTFARE